MTAPERIWATWKEDFGAVEIGTWADTVRFEPLGTEYTRTDLIQPMIDKAVAEALERAADACTNIIQNYDVMLDEKTYAPIKTQKAAKGMVSLVREDIRAMIPTKQEEQK